MYSMKMYALNRPIKVINHLYATINNKERKFVISKKREEYALLEKQGIANLDTEVLKGLIEIILR